MSHVETKKETRSLKVKLFDDELLEMSRRLVATDQEIERHEQELDRVKSDIKAKVQECEGRRKQLSACVSSGYEYRAVDCVRTRDWKNQTITVMRTDTGEVIEDRRMYESEIQEGAQRGLPMSINLDETDA